MSRVDYRNTFTFDASVALVWGLASEFDQYPVWWTWLREFKASSATLSAGTVLRGVVVPPLPYRLRMQIHVDRSEPFRSLSATVDGDLRGWATADFVDVEGGSEVTVAWALDFRHPALRLAAKVAYPVVRWGHDRVVDQAVDGFRRRALGDG